MKELSDFMCLEKDKDLGTYNTTNIQKGDWVLSVAINVDRSIDILDIDRSIPLENCTCRPIDQRVAESRPHGQRERQGATYLKSGCFAWHLSSETITGIEAPSRVDALSQYPMTIHANMHAWNMSLLSMDSCVVPPYRSSIIGFTLLLAYRNH
jgi:hypothetical protein